MPVRMPGFGSGLIPKGTVKKLIKAEKIPIKKAQKRKEETVKEKEAVEKFQSMLNELGTAANSIKSKLDFYKRKVESSHPDIIEGTVENFAILGNYEFEVRGLAKSEKELAYGFPDKDKTSVGFGYMQIHRNDKESVELTVEPGSTLQDVANQINDLDAGIKAMVVNTKYDPNPYRLLVVSEESGKEAKITLDEDTTYMDFKEQVSGRNLDVLFEDVPVTDKDNNLEELVDGVVFHVKRSQPGTRVQVNVVNDIEATLESIKSFVDKYNEIARFAAKQSISPKQGKPGPLSGDGSVKTVMRQLQYALSPAGGKGGKYSTLAEIGITTNPKTGELRMDQAKVKQALAEDYDSVAQLFIRSKDGLGVGARVSQKLRNFNNYSSGVITTKIRGLERIIENQDDNINRKQRQLQQKEKSIRRRFSRLEGRLMDMQQQGNFLAQRFGAQGGGGGGAPQGGGGQ